MGIFSWPRTLVQVISASQYRFDRPAGISSNGNYVWVTNRGDDLVSVLRASTGKLAGVGGPKYGQEPDAVSSFGKRTWIADWGSESLTEVQT
jgi:DNA-binding beta-propeller fold protein YncE